MRQMNVFVTSVKEVKTTSLVKVMFYLVFVFLFVCVSFYWSVDNFK